MSIKIVTKEQLQTKRDVETGTEEQRAAVLTILNQVKKEGDQALFEYTRQFDGVSLSSLKIPSDLMERAAESVSPSFYEGLKEAANNIRQFHEQQKRLSWMDSRPTGTILGQLIQPLNRVGLYVPGGTAAYPSSVLMNAIPAQVAGVKEIVMVTPPSKEGAVSAGVLAACHLLGIKEVYSIGGAQAIAALAYGTETIQPVDKIVGPGNIYVALAKREVFGVVDIDMVAGPSEIVVVADEGANPRYVAADLLSQAEHDVMASAVCITTSPSLAEAVKQAIEEQLSNLPRKEIALQSLLNYGAICVVKDIEEALEVVNQLAPEHLELMVSSPFNLLGKVKNAGAIFLGSYSSEPVGDYFAGPNHVLPTNGTARFSSPLNVDDFVKKSSLIYYSKEDLLEHGEKIITMAEVEGLEAHANAIRIRLEEEGAGKDE
ncbi:histidinol dehydrogenase [Microaerobacter geothermalis]|nr:histidinol dehydrogenase [Microaerobacter geothermalis]MCF6094568.1 histidinol dehydrogenase [Microaerobacter geothermalis]